MGPKKYFLPIFRVGCQRRRYSTGHTPVRLAVVGSGPAGFYCLQTLLKRWPPGHGPSTVDLFDKLPVPYGLVRFGVAPDHPEVKNCIHQFEKTVEEFEAANRFRYYGNVNVGRDVSVKELAEAYHAVLLAYGSEREKTLGIPGEMAQNCMSARQFVGWYNGLPGDQPLNLDLTSLHNDTAVVFGHGNVALDVARILLAPVSLLAETDICSRAFDQLTRSRIKRVILIGRRGPLQVSFTIAEVREMIRLAECRHFVDKADFESCIQNHGVMDKLERPRKRLTQLMIDNAKNFDENSIDYRECPSKHWRLMFLHSPRKILTSNDAKNRVVGVELVKNKLDVNNDDYLNAKAIPLISGQTTILQCSLVLYSVGYQSINIDEKWLPFDDRRHVIRVEDRPSTSSQEPGTSLPFPCRVYGTDNVYACGWCATGPRGVIASTQAQSRQVAERIIGDFSKRTSTSNGDKPGHRAIEPLLRHRQVQYVDWAGWKKIDRHEIESGKKTGKSREKITDIETMLKIATT